MQQRPRGGDREQQRGQVPGLDQALLDEQVAVVAGVRDEPLLLLRLLRGGLDHLDPPDRLAQPGIERAEPLPHLPGHRAELPHVPPEGDHERHREQQRRQQQPGVEESDEDDRDDALQQRVDDQVDARRHHEVQLADVVRRPRHQVADPLPVVERLALAEQADVQLVPGVPFQPFGQHLAAQPGTDVDQPADGHDQQEHEHHHGQLPAAVGSTGQDGVERPPGQPGHGRVEPHHGHRTQHEARAVAGVAQQVGGEPAGRAASIRPVLAGDGELRAERNHDQTSRSGQPTGRAPAAGSARSTPVLA